MLDITTTKNKELGLWDITATLTLPPITVTTMKKEYIPTNFCPTNRTHMRWQKGLV